MWVVSGDIADLITAIIYLDFLRFFFIYGVDFHGFIDMSIPGLILSLIFISLREELLSSLFFIPLNDSSINLKGKFYYTGYVGGLIHSEDFILNIVL